MNEHRRWTQSDVTELRRCAAPGNTSLYEAADLLGRSSADVAAMTARLRLSFRAVEPRRPGDAGE